MSAMRAMRRRGLHPAIIPLVACIIVIAAWHQLANVPLDRTRLTSQCPRAIASTSDTLPVCVSTRRGSCISLSTGSLRPCPRTYQPDSCRLLPESLGAAHLCAVVVVSSSVACPCTLPTKLLRLLLELDAAVEFALLVSPGMDDACAQPAYKLLRDSGVTVHTCYGAKCPASITHMCKAKLTVVVRDSVEVAPGTFQSIMTAARQMPGSILSASVHGHSGQLVFVAEPNSGFSLTQVEQLPTYCLLGHTADFAAYQTQQLFLTSTISGPSMFVHSARVHVDHADSIQVQPTPVRNVLFIDGYLPTPDKDSGSRRTAALISLLIQQRSRVTFQAIVTLDQVNLATPAEAEEYKSFMVDLGARVLQPGMPSSWPRDPYTIIVVSRRDTMNHVIDFLQHEYPKAGIMYDTVDLHFLRETRLGMASSVSHDSNLTIGIGEMNEWLLDPANARAAATLRESRGIELSYMSKSHVTIVVSAYEEEVVHQYIPQAPVAVISNIIVPPLTFDIQSAPLCGERSGLLFVGQFGHTPNQQAIDTLLKYIIPDMMQRGTWKQMPDMHIVGSGKLPQQLRDRIARHSFMHIHTDLSDAELSFLYSEVRVAIAPLVSGAGVKGKINQAMSLGVPVVATSVAVEAMHIRHGQDCMVAETLNEFTAYLEAVYFNDALCNRLARSAYDSVYRHFSVQEARTQLIKAIDRLGLVLGTDLSA